MKETGCCCPSIDAHECVVRRHPELVKDWIVEDDGIDPDDYYCECCCHDTEGMPWLDDEFD